MVFLKTDRGEVNKLQVPSILYVGRGNSSDIRPDSKSVSKSHGQLTVLFNAKTGKPEAWIEDFNSTFGTFVGETPDNLEKITEKTRLFFGFYIRFGHAPYCYQYLELDPNDDDTTCAKTTDFMESGATTLSKVNATKYSQKTIQKLHLTEDEEFAMLLQQQLNEAESPTKPRIQALVNQFEAGAQWSPETSSKGSPPKKELPELSVVKDIVQKFETSASPRTPSPQTSARFFEGTKKKQLAKLQTESFSESAWVESQSVAPTPTVCLPPKNDGSFKGTMYHFLDDKYIEEKAGADEDVSRTNTARSTVEAAAPVRDFDSEWSTKQLPLPPRPTSVNNTAAYTEAAVPTSRQSTPQSTPPTSAAQDRTTTSGRFAPPMLEKSSSKTLAGPAPMSDTERATVEALHKKKVDVIRARQIFRQKKLSTLPSVVQKYPTFGSVAKQWRKAVAEVDFIPGGFCMGVNRKKKERTLEKNAEIYRHTLNANPKSPVRKQSRALTMDAAVTESASPLEQHEWVKEPTAPLSVDDRPLSSIRKSASGREMDSLKEFIDKGDVYTNVEYILSVFCSISFYT